MKSIKDLKTNLFIVLGALAILGFGIGTGTKCSDGSTFTTYAAVGLAFKASGADICDHRSALLNYGR